MALSNDLISRFVKTTKDTTKEKNETIVYGTIHQNDNGNYCVQIDGSDILTPVSTTTVIAENDRVTVMIKNHTAVVTGNLSSPSARSVDTVEIAQLNASNARIDTLETANTTVQGILNAHQAVIDELDSKYVSTDYLDANYITANKIKTDYLTAEQISSTYATISELEAVNAKIDNLDVSQGNIDNLTSEIAEINTLIFGSAEGNVIQTSFSNAVIAQLGDTQIKSAMIENISASKITSGDIITNNVRVMSEDGSLIISDETLQISDSTRVRVQIGKDASNDYSINIWDQNGNLMFSKGGITDAAIKEAIIRNDMVSDTANIHASKLDIDSLFEEINGSSNTIKSTKVYLDEESQTLDVAFKSLTTEVTDQGETISSQGTAISAIQGQISSKIWQQDIDTATNEMSTQYSTLEQEVDSFKTTVSETYATISDVENIETEITNLDTRVTSAESSITQLSNSITANVAETTNLGTRMTTVEQTAEDLSVELDELEIGVRNYIRLKKISSYAPYNLTPTYSGTTITTIRNSSNDSTYLTLLISGFTPSNSVYTLSGYLKVNGSIPETNYFTTRISTYGTDETRNIYDPETGYFEFTQLYPGTSNYIIHAKTVEKNVSGSVVTFDKLKFERGTKATDWTPAPEDVESDILDASKTATNYLNFSSNGLVIGDMTVNTLGKNVLIDSESVKIRTGTTDNAIFGADIIELAKDNESATISMLNGEFKIYYDSDNSDGGFGVYGKDQNGNDRLAFQPVNENGNTTLGWGNYDAKSGNTNIYGNDVQFAVASCESSLFRPYYRAGDSIEIEWYGAGFVSSSSTVVYFSIPLAKPVVGGTTPSVTVTAHSSEGGLRIRQNGNYVYGSASDTHISPSSYKAQVCSEGNLVRIEATMANTTNAVNNAPCGVDARIKLTFN